MIHDRIASATGAAVVQQHVALDQLAEQVAVAGEAGGDGEG